MKKLQILEKILLLFFITIKISAQDLVNPYEDQTTLFNTGANNEGFWSIGNTSWPYVYKFSDNNEWNVNNLRVAQSPYYKGEYEICIKKHFWWDVFSLDAQSPAYSTSWQYEIVSFPFTTNCSFQTGGCVTAQGRVLSMPDPSNSNYDQTNNRWDYNNTPAKLYNSISVTPFLDGYSSGPLSGGPPANTLVSGMFVAQSGFLGTGRRVWPHTIIKHTVNLHCSATPSASNIISSFSWYYDNTRGRMRWYPFMSTNNPNGNQHHFDEIFIPELVLNNYQEQQNFTYYEHAYNNTDNDIIMSNGTINYFPYSDIAAVNSTCASGLIPTNVDVLRTASGGWYQFPFPTPYTVFSNPLRHEYGSYFAGYEKLGTNPVAAMSGMKQNYLTDQNIDLTIINSTEHVIYNPSEVNITASNLRFPSGYTFKTVRGVYPTIAEVASDDIIENGGPFNDPRDVPVKTDLISENTTTDPTNQVALTYPHLFASRYYLNDPAQVTPVQPMLTIEPCVKFFDCTFDVYPGGTLFFEEYPAILGKEDHSSDHTNTRYKIQTLGGAVLRNYADIQYLQNGIISQTMALNYKATDKIIAGKDVTWSGATPFDIDVPQGDYSVENGADVTLQATNTIRLTDGFSVKAGGKFHAFTSSPGVPATVCSTPSSLRMAAGKSNKSNHKISFFNLTATPNPSPGKLTLTQFNKPIIAQQLQITDTYGRTIFTKASYNSAHDAIDLSTQPNGLYIARCITNGEAHQVKFVVNK